MIRAKAGCSEHLAGKPALLQLDTPHQFILILTAEAYRQAAVCCRQTPD
jgi:hypothetical protein